MNNGKKNVSPNGKAAEKTIKTRPAADKPSARDDKKIENLMSMLYGEQLDEFHQRFLELEEMISELKVDLKNSHEKLEKRLNDRIEKYNAQSQKEIQFLKNDLENGLRGKISELEKKNENEVAALKKSMTDATLDLKASLDETRKDLSAGMSESSRKFSERVGKLEETVKTSLKNFSAKLDKTQKDSKQEIKTQADAQIKRLADARTEIQTKIKDLEIKSEEKNKTRDESLSRVAARMEEENNKSRDLLLEKIVAQEKATQAKIEGLHAMNAETIANLLKDQLDKFAEFEETQNKSLLATKNEIARELQATLAGKMDRVELGDALVDIGVNMKRSVQEKK